MRIEELVTRSSGGRALYKVIWIFCSRHVHAKSHEPVKMCTYELKTNLQTCVTPIFKA